ncbi:MAG TPA: hydantoinase B/oxoprolinase family protein [Ramlibacter sp.]|uniref:hydantoinase B/oxoprolinase family protein n=1 Tax=Ramlibacter sp. TaxID=1917967 RepID=UPI002CCE0C71|nr:hydantoinase B/oxoprolinase family protein [Ramlibacter sp.]HVZ46811.1 hydantoinase B/oxoprolinase family protein [Ramlibacter sp.]
MERHPRTTARFGEFELIRESMVAVVNEMRANVIHASFSSIIYEGHDFSCALLTREGKLLAQSLDDNPIHIFAVPHSAAEILKRYAGDLREGDAFLHNDPYTGGTHLNDILLLKPIFVEGALLAFAAVRSHWGDVGGMTPGSISGRSTEIYQEGVRIPPTRIASGGQVHAELMELLFANMRGTPERRGDFQTMMGAAAKASEHVRRLADRFGARTLQDATDTLIANADAVMRQRIRECPNGVYCTEGYVESNGHTDVPLVARLRMTVHDDWIDVDFWDASPQTAGPTNVGPAMAINSAGTILKAFLDPDTPINHGSFQPIRVHAPEGTFINARPPVACAGSVEVKTLLDSLIAGALGQAVRQKMVGDLKGTGNHVSIAGDASASGGRSFYLFYEYPAGGTAATRQGDGSHCTRTYTEGDFNSIGSAEVIESEMPLVVEQIAIRCDSHGHGRFRGGCGMRRDIRVLEPGALLSVLSDRNTIPPYGVAGASAGQGNRFVVLREGELVATSPIPGKIAAFALQPDDILRMETAGGGGWGDPAERELAAVASDVALGFTSIDMARERYGVVLSDSGAVDERESAKRRQEIGQARVMVAVTAGGEDVYDGPRRVFEVPPSVARRLDAGDGTLCEIANPGGPSLRGWLRVAPHAAEGALSLGPFAREVLRCEPASRFELRRIAAMA